MTDVSDFSAEQLTEFFTYLDGLRLSRTTNMFGAGPWLEAEFEMDRRAARDVLMAWQRTFDDAPPEQRAETALAKATA